MGTRYPEIWDTRYLNKTSLDGTVTTVLAQANNYIPMGRERYADMVIYVDSVLLGHLNHGRGFQYQ